MGWEPKKEVVEVMALWLFHKEHPDVLDWEADEKAADAEVAARKAAAAGRAAGQPPTNPGAARTEYEERARAMLMIARSNSGSGG